MAELAVYQECFPLVPLVRSLTVDLVPSDGTRLDQEQTHTLTRGRTPKAKVLVVDDERLIANTLAIILRTSGFEAYAVYSGEEALQALSSFEPDVLISDVIMIGMTGIDTAIAVENPAAELQDLAFLRSSRHDRPTPRSS